MVSVKELGELVERKLSEHAEDRRPWPGPGDFVHDLSLDEYRGLVATFVEYMPRVAQEFEHALLQIDPEREPDDMLALYAVSKHRRNAERALALAANTGPLGWNARRALRALRLS